MKEKITLTKYAKKIFARSGLNKIATNLNQYLKIKSAKQKISQLNLLSPYQLHVGCGKNKLKGWLNIDLEDCDNVTDLVWDASLGFPFLEDASCSKIYNEHFLEHLTIEQATVFLQECFRVLTPEGILRIAMPSLENVITQYQSPDWKNQEWLHQHCPFIKTRAEMINICFRWWGHQWLYDREELHRRLKEVGFKQIMDQEWGKSDILELNNLETRKESLLICEAIK